MDNVQAVNACEREMRYVSCYLKALAEMCYVSCYLKALAEMRYDSCYLKALAKLRFNHLLYGIKIIFRCSVMIRP
jgi:hypothetical protein